MEEEVEEKTCLSERQKKRWNERKQENEGKKENSTRKKKIKRLNNEEVSTENRLNYAEWETENKFIRKTLKEEKTQNNK